MFQAIDWIAADADRRGLTQAKRGQLRNGFIRERTGTRDDANPAFFVDMAWHDADLELIRRDHAWTIRPQQARFAVFAAHPVFDFDHTEYRYAFKIFARPFRIDAGHISGAAIRILTACAGMKLARLAGDALGHDFGVFIDQNTHLNFHLK